MKIVGSSLPESLQTATRELLIASTAMLSSSTLPPAEIPRPEREHIQFVQAPVKAQEGGLGGLGKAPGAIPRPVAGDVATEWLGEFEKRIEKFEKKGSTPQGREIKVFADMVRDPEAFKLIKGSATELLRHLDPKDEKDLKGQPKEVDTIKILKRISETTDPKEILKSEATAKSALSGLRRGTNVYLLRYGPEAGKEDEK